MNFEHYRDRISVIAVKNVLQDKNDEFHRREIVVVENDFEKLWFFEPRFGLGYNASVLRLCSLVLIVVITVTGQERILVSNLQARKGASFRLARPRIHNLDHLIEADRASTSAGKAS